MAYHFSANQFEEQYSPRKLGNWEYPKWYPERPRQRFKPTKIIADDCGRLLDGVKRGGNAWGNYVGTWDLPRRITRDYVQKLIAPDERIIQRWSVKKKEPSAAPEATEEVKPTPEVKPEGSVGSTKSTESVKSQPVLGPAKVAEGHHRFFPEKKPQPCEAKPTCDVCNRPLAECTCSKKSDSKSQKSSDEVEMGEKCYPCPACKGDQWNLVGAAAQSPECS